MPGPEALHPDNNNNTNGTNAKDRVRDAVLANTQSTHNQATTSSVGMLLLWLYNRYFPRDLESSASESDRDEMRERRMNEAFKQVIAALRQFSQGDTKRQQSIDNIVERAGERNNFWDTAKLYFPDLTEDKQYQDFVFPLKHVLVLVWWALKDDVKFTHHFEGTPEDRLKAANQDRSNRISNLFSVLQLIKNDPLCHTGGRHDLVFLLNETYEGVHIIEDTRATIMAFLKDRINDGFWAAYNLTSDPDKKEALQRALFTWMRESNPREMLSLVDPENRIRSSLNHYFLERGINPSDVQLDEKIDEALASLAFDCDPKEHPSLAEINAIFTTPGDPEPAANAARLIMQDWIQNRFKLDDETDQPKIRDFYRISHAYRVLNQHEFLLTLSGAFNQFQALRDQCVAYFSAFKEGEPFPEAPGGIADDLAAVHSAVYACKQSTMSDQIENFFVQLSMALKHKDGKTLERLYAMLLKPELASKIILTDDEIQRFIETNVSMSEHAVDITPYWINRVFLHAIILRPQEWSPLFADVFQQTRAFVENSFNQETNGRATALMRDSYTPTLRNQLAHLETCWRAEQDTEIEIPKRPPLRILMPHDVRTYQDWHRVCVSVDNAMLEKIYPPLSARIDRILSASLEHFSIVLQHTPENRRFNFLMLHRNRIRDAYELDEVLLKLTDDIQRCSVAWDLKDLIKNGIQLTAILHQLPKDQCYDFAKDQKDKIQNGHQLALVLHTLPEDQLYGFVEDQKDKIQNAHELGSVLECFSQKERCAFALAYKSAIQDVQGLMVTMRYLDREQQLELIIACREDLIQNVDDLLGLICSFFPPSEDSVHWFDVVIACKDSIKDADQLCQLMECLMDCDSPNRALLLRLAIACKDSIKDADQLNHFMNYFSKKNQQAELAALFGMKVLSPSPLKMEGRFKPCTEASHSDITVHTLFGASQKTEAPIAPSGVSLEPPPMSSW